MIPEYFMEFRYIWPGARGEVLISTIFMVTALRRHVAGIESAVVT